MRRVAIGIVVLAACGGRARENAPAGSATAVRTAQVTRGPIADRTVLTGELRAGAQVELVAPKTDAWQITIRWMVEDGATVKQGDRVLEFDNSSITAGLEQKKLAARDAAAQFASAREVSAMTVTEKDFEAKQHQIALAKAKLLASVPDDLLDKRTSQERKLAQLKAEVALDGADRQLAAQRSQATLDDRVKQIELDKATRALELADKTLENLIIKAPTDGVISIGDHPWEGRRFVPGDSVQPGMTIMTLPDLTKPMEVRADLSDVDDGRVAIGQVGTCTLDAYPGEPLPCTVTDLAPVARAKNRQSLRRGFAVKLSVVTKNPELRPGMSVRIELPGRTAAPGLRVPRGAVHFADTTVTLGSGESRTIELGACDAQHCAIVKGLAEGDTVILAGGGA